MQRPNLFKPVPAQEGDQNAPEENPQIQEQMQDQQLQDQQMQNEQLQNQQLQNSQMQNPQMQNPQMQPHLQQQQMQSMEGSSQAPLQNISAQAIQNLPIDAITNASQLMQMGNLDVTRAFQAQTSRILADGMTISDQVDPTQALHFTALHNAMPQNQMPESSMAHPSMPMTHVSMPFQQLLQADALPMSPQSFEAAARRIAWSALNPGTGPPPLGLTDKDDPAWRVWEERFQYYKAHGIGNRGKREKMVYTRPMPHARKSMGALTAEEEEADRQSCSVMNNYLQQKFERLKEYNLIP